MSDLIRPLSTNDVDLSAILFLLNTAKAHL